MSTSRRTPTSPDASDVRPRDAQQRRYRRTLGAVIGVLALVAAVFATGAVLRGPQLSGETWDAAAATAGPSTVKLVFDTALADVAASDLVVEPAAEATVTTDGKVVVVAFAAALDYDTAYRLRLEGVRAAGGGAAVDVERTLRTDPLTMTWVDRYTDPDRVLSGPIGQRATVLDEEAAISDVLPLGGATLVLGLEPTADGAGATSTATIVGAPGSDSAGMTEQLLLPGDGLIEDVVLAGTTVLYRFAPSGTIAFDAPVYAIDLTGSHISTPVLDIGGSPISAYTLLAEPGGTALIHTFSGDVLRYDPASTDPPVLITSAPSATAVSPDGTSFSGADGTGPFLYDLTTGERTPVAPLPVDGADAYVGEVVPLGGGRLLERAIIPTADLSEVVETVVLVADGATTRLYTPPDGGVLLDFRATPNGQYAVIEVSPSGADSDGYPSGSRPQDVATVVVDIASGAVIAQWAGSHAKVALAG